MPLPTGAIPRERNWLLALKAYLCWRLPVEVLVVLTAGSLPQGPGATGMPPLDGPSFLHPFLRWDSGWYLNLIRNGYQVPACALADPPCQSNIAFFPLYPMLARALTVVGMGESWAMLWVPHMALLLGLWGMAALSRAKNPGRAPDATLAAVLCFPSALFFSAGYSEAVLFAAAAWAFVFYERQQLWPLALAVGAACLTRSNGVLLAAALMLGAALQKRWKVALALALGAGLAIGGLCLFMHAKTGDPIAFIHARKAWGFHGSAWGMFRNHFTWVLSGGAGLTGYVDVLSIGLLALSAALALKHLGPAYAAFIALTLAVPMSMGQLWALSRIALSAMPMFLVLARSADRPFLGRALLCAGLATLTLDAVYFANGFSVN